MFIVSPLLEISVVEDPVVGVFQQTAFGQLESSFVVSWVRRSQGSQTLTMVLHVIQLGTCGLARL